jgi:5-methylcytosine-specific restriction endonuclease McrA
MVRLVKKKIPKAMREAVWIRHVGKEFQHKCLTKWCPNTMTVFDFQTSHNIPESKGGETSIDNLYPLCGRCNQSMGNQYTFTQWNQAASQKMGFFQRIVKCFKPSTTVSPVALGNSPTQPTM